MESTAFFEKKVSLTPNEFNQVKNTPVDSLLEKKAKELVENKCSEQGFVLPGSVKLLSRSMGYFESARFTGDAVYYLKLEGKIVYPADGIRVIGEVIRKNKMGLYVDYRNAIRIQVPRDLHIGSEEYENVEVGDTVEVEIKRSKFQINDPYILASGMYIATKTGNSSQAVGVSNAIQGGPDIDKEGVQEETLEKDTDDNKAVQEGGEESEDEENESDDEEYDEDEDEEENEEEEDEEEE